MAKDKRILIEFDQDILEGFEQNNNAAFTVTGNRYRYVGGDFIAETYPVTKVSRPTPPQGGSTFASKAAFATGKFINTQSISATLTLKEVSS